MKLINPSWRTAIDFRSKETLIRSVEKLSNADLYDLREEIRKALEKRKEGEKGK